MKGYPETKSGAQLESPRAMFRIDAPLIARRAQIQGAGQIWLAEISQDQFQPFPDTKVDDKEKQCRNRAHHKDHSGGHQNLATSRPDDLGHFRADLLDELERIGTGCHVRSPSGAQIRALAACFKTDTITSNTAHISQNCDLRRHHHA
jgi:hypothetical protein